ncbi:keratin-associated protein 4-5 isoform X2 [Siniperca chuatsi]|uniref:keratin-associated protein 4-5 isoform X2 n=1 Tax=Siniperca chuatsi TaxID=119488 RepID=UPI001CE06B16|nr:keratin-associated protein 4-5 isoform X2 [Siniperca chuatsi]
MRAQDCFKELASKVPRYDVSLATVKGAFSERDNVLPVWGLAIPLPAVLMITLSLYMIVLGIGLWIRSCLKDRCCECGDCCPDISLCEQCFRLAEMCDCRLPTLRSCRADSCPSPSCVKWDCACTCQPPECDSCNCLCFEIRIK